MQVKTYILIPETHNVFLTKNNLSNWQLHDEIDVSSPLQAISTMDLE